MLSLPAVTEVCERIAVEILKVVNFYQFTYRSSTLEGIYLVGAARPWEEREMSIGIKESANPEVTPAEAGKPKKPKKQQKKNRMPHKRTMNLYYKPDRTTKPATIALYVLFVFVCLLGLSKVLVYDLWMETKQARRALVTAQNELNGVLAKLTDYDEVKERYQRYSATDEERSLIDRMEILALLDEAVGSTATMHSISISSNAVQIQFSGVTLAQTAEIVRALESSPIVASITVSTASTTGEDIPEDDSSPVQANARIQLTKEVAK